MHFINIFWKNDLLPILIFNLILAAFEYLSNYDHFIVSNTLKKLQDLGKPEMPLAKKEEFNLATSNFSEFQVN